MNRCPHCQQTTKQVKAGRNRPGSQRIKCNHCLKRYTPEYAKSGYSSTVHRQAIQMSIDGINQRRIARLLGISQKSVSNWVKEAASRLPPKPSMPETPVENSQYK